MAIPWPQSTVTPVQPHPLWAHGWGEDQLISACFAMNPESPAPSRGPMSARAGLWHCCVCSAQQRPWAGLATSHVLKTFSSCSSLFLFRIRFIPFILLSAKHSFVEGNFECSVENPCLCLALFSIRGNKSFKWPLAKPVSTESTAQPCALPALSALRASCTSSCGKKWPPLLQKC